MLGARSMSSLNASSKVLMLNPTLAFGKARIRSMSRSTRSDFVWMVILTPTPLSCSSSARVRRYVASCGLYGSVTELMKMSFPAYFSGFLISGHCLTSRNSPHGSAWFVNRFMKLA